MALDTQSAVIGGASKTLIVAKDAQGNIAAAHVSVDAAGAEKGTQANPHFVSITAQPTDAVVGAKLDGIATNTAAGATAAGQATALTPIAATATALGAPGDAAWSGSGSGALVAISKAIWTKLGAVLTVSWSGQSVGITGTVAVTDVAAETALSTIATNTGTAATASGQTSALTQATASATGIGTPADTAWSAGAGTLVALGKAIVAAIKGTLTTTVSNTVAVTGTFFQATQPVSITSLPLPAGAALDGTDATGITPPSGAVGIRGWLSGIYARLAGTLSVSDPQNAAYSTWPAVTPASGTYTLPAGTRNLSANVTAAGNISMIDAAGNVKTFPLAIGGIQTFPFLPVSFTTTATATFWADK